MGCMVNKSICLHSSFIRITTCVSWEVMSGTQLQFSKHFLAIVQKKNANDLVIPVEQISNYSPTGDNLLIHKYNSLLTASGLNRDTPKQTMFPHIPMLLFLFMFFFLIITNYMQLPLFSKEYSVQLLYSVRSVNTYFCFLLF